MLCIYFDEIKKINDVKLKLFFCKTKNVCFEPKFHAHVHLKTCLGKNLANI